MVLCGRAFALHASESMPLDGEYCKIYRDKFHSAFHPSEVGKMSTIMMGVKSEKGVAPSPALVALANENGASGSPSTAVEHFTLLKHTLPALLTPSLI